MPTRKNKVIEPEDADGYTLVFGDSFIGPLKLFKHPRWIFIKFKGGTMKGLTKPDNENRLIIENTIQKFVNAKKLNAVIFCFGTVDIQFSYYYSKLMNKQFNPDEIVTGYIQYIKSIINPKKYKVGVQLAYPTAVKPNNMLLQLENYHIVDDFYGFPKRDLDIELTEPEKTELIKIYNKLKNEKRPEALKILEPEFAMDMRIKRLNEFNNLIKRKLHGTHIHYIDMVRHLVNNKGYVKPGFIDPSVVNVHFRWEPQIPFMLREFKFYGLTDKFMGNIKKIMADERKYLKDKYAKLKELNNIVQAKTKKIAHNQSLKRRAQTKKK